MVPAVRVVRGTNYGTTMVLDSDAPEIFTQELAVVRLNKFLPPMMPFIFKQQIPLMALSYGLSAQVIPDQVLPVLLQLQTMVPIRPVMQ